MVCWCQKHHRVKRSRNVPSQHENKFKEVSTEVQMSEIMKGDNQQTLLTILGTNLWLLLFNTQHFMTLGGFFCCIFKKDIKVSTLEGTLHQLPGLFMCLHPFWHIGTHRQTLSLADFLTKLFYLPRSYCAIDLQKR